MNLSYIAHSGQLIGKQSNHSPMQNIPSTKGTTYNIIGTIAAMESSTTAVVSICLLSVHSPTCRMAQKKAIDKSQARNPLTNGSVVSLSLTTEDFDSLGFRALAILVAGWKVLRFFG